MIADEPTTALDATIQAEILGLIDRLRRENGVAVLFITHDMAVVAQMADRVVVMHRGDVVEEASSPASPGAASRAATSPDATALVVGCAHAWFNRFRRLTIRHERRADIYAAFTSLAASLITPNPIRRFCWVFLMDLFD